MASHVPVLLDQTINSVLTDEAGDYVDCTGGAGGHSQKLLSRLAPTAHLIVLDCHLPTAQKLQQQFAHDQRVTVLNQRFADFFSENTHCFDGVMADLGISSLELDDPQLGIGFQLNDAPLDMRFDSAQTETAADKLLNCSETELADMFFYLGGERASRKIARAIVTDRDNGTLVLTTSGLRDLCARVLGRFYRTQRIHAATKVFQALRISVNRELEQLKTLLSQAPRVLKPQGRLAVIAFHEGEDRLVKHAFRDLAQTPEYRLLFKKAERPSAEEVKANPRSRSSCLRVLERTKLSEPSEEE